MTLLEIPTSECKAHPSVPEGSLLGHHCTCEKSKTVGEMAVELQKSREKQDVIETQREMQKNYIDELIKCAMSGTKKYGKEKPFYICVQTRRERLLTNVIRNQFYSRRTRPIPQYDLALYFYDPAVEQLAFVWCIPAKDMVEYLIINELNLPVDQRQLVEFCKSFKANTLI